MADHLESDIKNVEHGLAELKRTFDALERRMMNIERSAGGSVYELERRMGLVDDLERRLKTVEADLAKVKHDVKEGQSMDFGLK